MKTTYKFLSIFLLVVIVTSSSCVQKFFPDHTLYQYPQKQNDVAVVYPDGTIHHSDGKINLHDEKIIQKKEDAYTNESSEISQPATIIKPDPKKQPGENTSSIKDGNGRHAKYRDKK